MSPEEIINAIEARCEPEGDCLLWTGGLNSAGHPVVRINGQSGVLARRAITEARRGEPIQRTKVMRPICGDKLCLADGHLRMMSRAQAMAGAGKLGRLSSAAKRVNCHRSAPKVLTAAIVREILASDETNTALGERYGCSHTTISAVRHGRTWRAINPMAGLL